jgi:hypothetical protein
MLFVIENNALSLQQFGHDPIQPYRFLSLLLRINGLTPPSLFYGASDVKGRSFHNMPYIFLLGFLSRYSER